MPSLVFVTPAHERFPLSAICLEQRRRVCAELTQRGVDATCVVVACDENLDTARELGLVALERPNDQLGARFNDGIEHACRELGADYVVPIGSDDWCLADYFLPLPDARTVLAGGRLCAVKQDGSLLACVSASATNPQGYIPWIIPSALLTGCGYRPGPDASVATEAAIANALMRRRDPFGKRTAHDLQLVDFKSGGPQCTPFALTAHLNPVEWLDTDPFARLASAYPADLCERVRGFYDR